MQGRSTRAGEYAVPRMVPPKGGNASRTPRPRLSLRDTGPLARLVILRQLVDNRRPGGASRRMPEPPRRAPRPIRPFAGAPVAEGMIRVDAVARLPAVLRELGLEPGSTLAAMGLDPRI